MAKNILHMMTPLAHMSPFDVNMALDAGYDATASYTHVSLGEITDLIQDAMFSRSPRRLGNAATRQMPVFPLHHGRPRRAGPGSEECANPLGSSPMRPPAGPR